MLVYEWLQLSVLTLFCNVCSNLQAELKKKSHSDVLLCFLTQGMALVFAPLRGETLRLFCELAQQAGLCVSQHQQYDAQVWNVHLKVRKTCRKQKDSAELRSFLK